MANRTYTVNKVLTGLRASFPTANTIRGWKKSETSIFKAITRFDHAADVFNPSRLFISCMPVGEFSSETLEGISSAGVAPTLTFVPPRAESQFSGRITIDSTHQTF